MGNVIKKLVEYEVILTISVILVAVAASFDASAAAKVTRITDDWKDDDDLSNAHKRFSWAASIGWIVVAIAIVVAILLIILTVLTEGLDFEIIAALMPIVVIIFVMTLIGIGFLSAWATFDVIKSSIDDDQDVTVNGLIATALSLGTIIAVVAGYLIKKYMAKRKKDETVKTELEVLKAL